MLRTSSAWLFGRFAEIVADMLGRLEVAEVSGKRRITCKDENLRNVGDLVECTAAFEKSVSHDDVETDFAVVADIVSVFGNQLAVGDKLQGISVPASIAARAGPKSGSAS